MWQHACEPSHHSTGLREKPRRPAHSNVNSYGDAMAISISPSYLDSKLDSPSIDDVIDVYEDRVRNWLLAPAKVVLEQEHGGPAAFCILLTYFEGAWSYAMCQSSKNRSKEFFSQGFVDVFKSSNVHGALLLRVGELLYSDARCGFFHDGMFRERVYFAEMNRDIVVTLPKKDGVLDLQGEIASVLIDVRRCYAAVLRHFDTKLARLRSSLSVPEREAFFAFFKSQCDWEKPGPVIGLQEPSTKND